jgi:flavin reductase (DIM6/NTAB) family NADH-FMN oxidoreductase RutF
VGEAEIKDVPDGFDPVSYRRALGCYPTGVAVMTAITPAGDHVGITVNSFTSVSLEPPLVSICLGKHLARFESLTSADVFNLNILREDQSDLSSQFAGSGREKWLGVRFRIGGNGIRILEPNLALLECERHHNYRAGDHDIVIARVRGFHHDGGAAPLLFYRGAYHRVTRSETSGE